jgi:hypothetical protein
MKRGSNQEGSAGGNRGLQRTNSQIVDNGILHIASSDPLINESFSQLPSLYESPPPMEIIRSRMQSFD